MSIGSYRVSNVKCEVFTASCEVSFAGYMVLIVSYKVSSANYKMLIASILDKIESIDHTAQNTYKRQASNH